MENSPLPPDPENMNAARADWAREAVRAFSDLTGSEMGQEALTDLLCDLQHYADRQGLDWEALLHFAGHHYDEETGKPGAR